MGIGLRWILYSLLLICSTSAFPSEPEVKEPGAGGGSGYVLHNSVIGSAGSLLMSPLYRSKSTLGQSSPIGVATGTQTRLFSGFALSLLGPGGAAGIDPSGPVVSKPFQIFPNPFNPATTIRYALPSDGPVTITVFNIQGRRLRTLVNAHQPSGAYEVTWDGRDAQGRSLGSGVYIFDLRIGSQRASRKTLLIR